jgi:galactokinase
MSPRSAVAQVGADATSRSSEVERRFQELYGKGCRIFRAPGRINLIGEHTDYNDGFVMPAAIDLSCWVAISPTGDRTVEVRSNNFKETRVFHLPHPDHDRPQRLGDWSDYVQGVALVLEESGYRLPGARMLVWSDVPMGAGLSSSAALEVASALALLDTQPAPCDRMQLALACQRAENEFVGARCGIMDQFVSSHARAGHVLMLDCRSLEQSFFLVPKGVCIVICNTMVKHEIAAGEYNRRRAECEEGVRLLSGRIGKLSALRDLSLQDLERVRDLLPATIYKRCRHVAGENQRVLDAAVALEQGNLQRLGDLMSESHQSLRDDYEVSCPELDLLVEAAGHAAGVYGARMTGGGFGGCTVNLVALEAVAGFAENIVSSYHKQTGLVPEIHVCTASQGAGRWESPK